MTREEAVNKLVRIRQLQGSKSEAHEALGMAIDALSQPSLPEGMEEASNDYARMETKDGSPYISIEAKAAFRAGAKWMARQGVTFEAKATRKYERSLSGFVSYLVGDEAGAIHKLINQGEEADVIVQIRKK